MTSMSGEKLPRDQDRKTLYDLNPEGRDQMLHDIASIGNPYLLERIMLRMMNTYVDNNEDARHQSSDRLEQKR